MKRGSGWTTFALASAPRARWPLLSRPLTLSLAVTVGFRDRPEVTSVALAIVVAAYLISFLASRILEKSSRRLPKTYDLQH